MSEPPGRRRRERVEVVRVQRPTVEFPVVHLEADIPTRKTWMFSIEGLVSHPHAWTLDELKAQHVEQNTWDLHCVWGWTRPALRWEGVGLARLIDQAGPLAYAGHAVARQIDGPYAACFTLEEIRTCMLAWRVDGQDLTPEHGGPLRLVTPPTKWGYKSVKWVGRLSVIESFAAGFWEEMVGNPRGDIPFEKLDLRFEPEGAG